MTDIPPSPAGLVRFLLKLNAALDVSNSRTWTKVGPRGTSGIMASPLAPEAVRSFAVKWEMDVTEAETFITDTEADDGGRVTRFVSLLDYLTKGAAAAGVDLETYAEQYLAGAGTHRPGRA
jgi:hypothetical protein